MTGEHTGEYAVAESQSFAIVEAGKWLIEQFNDGAGSILFYDIGGFPFMVLWLVAGGLYFTVRLGFVNFRLFSHAIRVVRGKYSSKDDPGEVTHFQALTAAISATVGLGNIAGVAVAVSLGGPGAVVWMMIAAFLGMTTKFVEVTMGQKYRHIDANGKVSGGAFHYLEEGLASLNMPKLGKILAIVFAACCIGASFGSGNLFQANQTVAIMTTSFDFFTDLDWAVALVLAVSVGTVLVGGIKRIAHVAEAVVPFMALVYVISALVVIGMHIDQLGEAVSAMFQGAFTGEAAAGGVVGAIIQGFKRATFSNEAGAGSAPIAHAAAKTKEPVREGCVALLEPFIDTIIICFLTGLVITITGVYQLNADGAVQGVTLTSTAFATVSSWFPMVLAVSVALFAYSTMITWSYYGERSWKYLFGDKYLRIYHILFCVVVFLGGMMDGSGDGFLNVVDFSDIMFLSMAVPNLIGLYFMSGMISKEVKSYISRLKQGEFDE